MVQFYPGFKYQIVPKGKIEPQHLPRGWAKLVSRSLDKQLNSDIACSILLNELLFCLYTCVYKSGVNVLYLLDRNTSGLITAEFSVTFTQEFHMRDINQFYSSLHKTQRLGLMAIDVINDTSKYLPQ